jgi:HPt (histidine-containing phosphotransfer) domain-containing protein
MNLRELAKSLELGMDEFLEIVGLFLQKSSSDLDEMQAGLNEGDGQKVISAAHSIKGASISIGLTDLCEIARQTEMEAGDNDLRAVSQKILVIRERLQQIAQILEDENRRMQ